MNCRVGLGVLGEAARDAFDADSWFMNSRFAMTFLLRVTFAVGPMLDLNLASRCCLNG